MKISCDGPRCIHDSQRVKADGSPTFREVSEAIARMVDRCPDRLSAAAVLCRGSDPHAVFRGIAELGVRRIELLPVSHGDELADLCPMIEDVASYAEFVMDYADRAADEGLENLPVLVRFEETVRFALGYGNPVVPCGAGRGFIGVGPDGTVYPCFRFSGVAAYKIGDVERGIDPGLASAFRSGSGRPAERREPCASCWAVNLCGGPCFSNADFFGPGDGMPPALLCAYKLADARAALKLAHNLRETDNEKLLEFLPIELDIF